ncbi:MAG TPA: hypothetical protein VHC23_02820, partial [Jatrophihabitans sp.]|nr:hypothetical protein [Jatrophihabitans sp.]
MRPPRARLALALAGATGLALTLAVAGSTADASPSTSVVINEAFGGGGNTGAPFQNDFVELKNVGSAAA